MVRCDGRSLRVGSCRWAAVLTAALVLIQLDPAARTAAALVGTLATGLGGAPVRESEPPTRSPGGESSGSEESVVARGKLARFVQGLDGGDHVRPEFRRSAVIGRCSAPLPAGRPDGFPAGGRAIRVLIQSHRC